MPLTSPLLYDFAATRVAFGWGRRVELGAIASRYGRRALIVWGSRTLARSKIKDEIEQCLAGAGVAPVELCTITREPLTVDVDRAVAAVREQSMKETLIIAIGGGSAIDLAKATAALLTNGDDRSVVDYLEGVGKRASITLPPLPMIAVPTTAGAGSEATKNAVISSHDPPFKKSLRAEAMLPTFALIDPELAVSAPPAITLQSGMDAITQLIESFVSRRARPFPQALTRDVLPAALQALPKAVQDGSNRPAREVLAHAAHASGMALANSGLGLAHGVAAALGVHCAVPHGLACATMLPLALKINRSSCTASFAELERCIQREAASMAEPSAGDDAIAADAFVSRIERMCRELGVPKSLGELGVRREQIAALVRDSRGNSMDGNPRAVSDTELTRLLDEHL